MFGFSASNCSFDGDHLGLEPESNDDSSKSESPEKIPPHDEVPEEPDQFAISVFKKQNNKATLLDSQQIWNLFHS